jgi:hypothetical protein
LVHALFMHLEFGGYLLNGEFFRSLGHRTPLMKE